MNAVFWDVMPCGSYNVRYTAQLLTLPPTISPVFHSIASLLM
jgi:hypothetical protein